MEKGLNLFHISCSSMYSDFLKKNLDSAGDRETAVKDHIHAYAFTLIDLIIYFSILFCSKRANFVLVVAVVTSAAGHLHFGQV